MSAQLSLLGDQASVRRPTPIEQARERGQAAGDRAAARNEASNPGWVLQALAKVQAFARHAPGFWCTEQMRDVIAADLPTPTDKRVWGRVTRDALRLGYIERVRGVTVPAASSNGSDKPAYRKGPNA